MYPIDDKQGRIKALQTKPLRARPVYPMIGKNGAKPYKMPDGPVKTIPYRVSSRKPLRGLTDG